jgi:hypothetical protein
VGGIEGRDVGDRVVAVLFPSSSPKFENANENEKENELWLLLSSAFISTDRSVVGDVVLDTDGENVYSVEGERVGSFETVCSNE